MLSVRQALISDSGVLTDIAARSEAYWGYDSDFMEKFKSIYCITEEFISQNPTFILENCGRGIGFYSILKCDMETSLEYFYIDSDYIGKGYGKLLWNHMVSFCKEQGIAELYFVTSPQAKEFYVKMGAVPIGEADSLVTKGRKIPKLVYKL